ncbi:type II secretion system protein M [Phenylobacterium sp. J367]|uniref:type II secretion system protein M n=1 Tax=Phenylobacterium sp. J367 TaxID=2898435 RepID=UPI0021507509|nr:type II secretion system protein M [Phenylobacterium sp. J367]MCR5881089.1 type II secretion system protein M [Phenylobacterium sp. J367]
MRTWFETRTRREQGLLIVMGVGLLAFLLWFGAWRPAAEAKAAAERRYAQASRDAVVVDRAVARLKILGSAKPRQTLPPAEAVNASAQAAGLVLARLQPDPAGGVQVAVAGVAPSRFFPWLAALQQDYGVTPRHLTVIKDEEGALSVDATFGGED